MPSNQRSQQKQQHNNQPPNHNHTYTPQPTEV